MRTDSLHLASDTFYFFNFIFFGVRALDLWSDIEEKMDLSLEGNLVPSSCNGGMVCAEEKMKKLIYFCRNRCFSISSWCVRSVEVFVLADKNMHFVDDDQ